LLSWLRFFLLLYGNLFNFESLSLSKDLNSSLSALFKNYSHSCSKRSFYSYQIYRFVIDSIVAFKVLTLFSLSFQIKKPGPCYSISVYNFQLEEHGELNNKKVEK